MLEDNRIRLTSPEPMQQETRQQPLVLPRAPSAAAAEEDDTLRPADLSHIRPSPTPPNYVLQTVQHTSPSALPTTPLQVTPTLQRSPSPDRMFEDEYARSPSPEPMQQDGGQQPDEPAESPPEIDFATVLQRLQADLAARTPILEPATERPANWASLSRLQRQTWKQRHKSRQ